MERNVNEVLDGQGNRKHGRQSRVTCRSSLNTVRHRRLLVMTAAEVVPGGLLIVTGGVLKVNDRMGRQMMTTRQMGNQTAEWDWIEGGDVSCVGSTSSKRICRTNV